MGGTCNTQSCLMDPHPLVLPTLRSSAVFTGSGGISIARQGFCTSLAPSHGTTGALLQAQRSGCLLWSAPIGTRVLRRQCGCFAGWVFGRDTGSAPHEGDGGGLPDPDDKTHMSPRSLPVQSVSDDQRTTQWLRRGVCGQTLLSGAASQSVNL